MNKKPKPTPPPKPYRLILYMPTPLMSAIDKAWHKRELPSRAATVRKLLEEALAQ